MGSHDQADMLLFGAILESYPHSVVEGSAGMHFRATGRFFGNFGKLSDVMQSCFIL
jgi:hypothetical protein